MGIKVLIVDDSVTARNILANILSSDPGIESVDSAEDAYIARDKIVENRPDVVCLDVEMPRMDGITFLKKLMTYMPLPVVMVSKLTKKGAQVSLDALEAGAIDIIEKPALSSSDVLSELDEELLFKVKSAAEAKIRKGQYGINVNCLSLKAPEDLMQKRVIAIGVSTGGVKTLKEILPRFPKNTPGMVVVQHMPADFTKAFAERLNTICEVVVKEAKNGDVLNTGEVLLAPGDLHMVLRRRDHRYYVELGSGQKVSGHRPSVDVLFNSVAKVAGHDAIGIILTGMGSDGARGLLNIRKYGGMTFGQDERSSIIYGMPKAAYEMGAVAWQSPLGSLPKAIVNNLEKAER